MGGKGLRRWFNSARNGQRPVFLAAIWLCAALVAVVLLVGGWKLILGALAPASSEQEIQGPPVPIAETPAPSILTLRSLELVDEYPLYVMHYYGEYRTSAQVPETMPGAACSIFAALGDPDNLIYGRNFDWEPSVAMLLYTYPSDGYASISMVNLGFLGFDWDEAQDLLSLGEEELSVLHWTPFIPIDGMNEAGLAVATAAVPSSEDRTDPTHPSIGSLHIMREMLDYAATVDEAIAVMEQFTILFDGGPPVHYLIGDATGRAVVVEFGTGQRHEIPNDQPWHMATNFLLESVGEDPMSQCNRYRTIAEELEAVEGILSSDEGMDLLERVSQEGTQWSAIYEISNLTLHVVMGQEYDEVHTFPLESVDP